MKLTRPVETRRRIVHTVVRAGAALAMAGSQMAAAAPDNITDGELALLPPYCQDVQAIRYGNATFNPSPRAPYWVSLMGPAFWALHHYCWGLIHVRRSEAPGLAPVLRTGMLNTAINDYFYVINNAPNDFVLAPEIYLRIGEARLTLGQIGLAHDAFRIARELKPNYWPAYTRWIDHLLKINQKATAKELAAEGLRAAPDSAELQERFRKLGGDPATVVPGPAQVPPSRGNASPPASTATPPTGENASEPTRIPSAPAEAASAPSPDRR